MRVVIKIGFFLCTSFFYGQVETQNNNIWLHYVGKNKIANKTFFTLEATMRYTDWLGEKQQWFIRPSFDYQITPKLLGSVGYTHYNTYSYGDIPINKRSIPEDHIWIQGTFTHHAKDFKFIHRLRDENRFVSVAVKNAITNEYDIDSYAYRNRVRYMFLMNYTLTQKDDKAKLFAVLGDEVFVNLGTNAGKTFFNQNRIIAGFGYNINSQNQIQLNYIQQHIWNFPNTIQEDNSTIRLSYITNLDFTKHK
ncbi:DUF2490 domain-containing protein [Mariniflexile jejuense]